MPDDLDFVGKLENFATDFLKICNKLEIDYKDIEKKNEIERKPYLEYYNSELLVEMVSEFYYKDIERFGYKFEKV